MPVWNMEASRETSSSGILACPSSSLIDQSQLALIIRTEWYLTCMGGPKAWSAQPATGPWPCREAPFPPESGPSLHNGEGIWVNCSNYLDWDWRMHASNLVTDWKYYFWHQKFPKIWAYYCYYTKPRKSEYADLKAFPNTRHGARFQCNSSRCLAQPGVYLHKCRQSW